jgi:hypothetical protein
MAILTVSVAAAGDEHLALQIWRSLENDGSEAN